MVPGSKNKARIVTFDGWARGVGRNEIVKRRDPVVESSRNKLATTVPRKKFVYLRAGGARNDAVVKRGKNNAARPYILVDRMNTRRYAGPIIGAGQLRVN